MLIEYKHISVKISKDEFSKYGITNEDLKDTTSVIDKILMHYYTTGYTFQGSSYYYSSKDGIGFTGELEQHLTLKD